MNRTSNILIRDPYMTSATKTDNHQHKSMWNISKQDVSKVAHNDHSKWKMEQELKKQLLQTKNDFNRMTRAYTDENRLNKKLLDYQAANNQYHEALKLRNLDLNNKISGLAAERQMMAQQFEGDNLRNYHQKNSILNKYEAQADELLQAKRTINNLIDLKSRLQEQIQHLSFCLQKQTDRFNLEMREQIIRMEGLQRSLKNLAETKDQQIGQLRHRIKIYEDQNKRLSDENRTLQITNASQLHAKNKQNHHLDNLSQINYNDSNTKDWGDHRTFKKELQQQKQINDRLQKQINDMKKKLFDNDQEDKQNENKNMQNHSHNESFNSAEKNKDKDGNDKFQLSKSEGLIGSISTLRNGINKQVFEVFFKSVRDGEKHRSNSLVIFIQNWRHLDIDRIQPYVQSYFEARNGLKHIFDNQQLKGTQIEARIKQCIPLRVGARKGRNEINTWVLSTIQFTKNQKAMSKNTLNNLLLFLFRLLTIQYRITYPMQGKSYSIDNDVKNQLNHEIVKAINYIIQFK